MKSQLTTSMPSASHCRTDKKRSGWIVNLFALCALLVGMGPLASWANEPVNVNLASAEVLAETLQGVGLAKAHRIIEYREAHGPFEHIDELAAVQGIGPATVEKNRGVIRLQ
jgi:competence protein ComEA